MYGSLCPYVPPPWLSVLPQVPEVKANLAMIPTPIHQWKLPGLPPDCEVHIKRDDLTGCSLSGNKIRKLEYLFGHILQRGYQNVITVGSLQSNHCRATAVVASHLGIKCHLLIECDDLGDEITGNMLLSRLCGANIYLVPKGASYDTEILPRQRALAEEIRRRTGEDSYVMAKGGSNFYGVFGYLNAWQELMEQGVCENFDDVVILCGSGGTVTGLAIGNYLTGQKVKIHAVTISVHSTQQHKRINKLIETIGLAIIKSEDIIDIIDGYVGDGYGTSTDDDHKFYMDIATATGVICDPVYVGKGVKGLISELNTNRSRFKGTRILYIHTGGIFGAFDGRLSNMFSNVDVHDWKDIENSPDKFFV